MADNKKYYYLKLKENFFDNDEMIVLESMQDGYLYSNILLKLYLRSLKYSGRLMFNDRIPFNSTMLAQVTRHNVGVVEKAMTLFNDLGLVEVMESGAIYMMDIQNFIGNSSSEADRQRQYQHKLATEKEDCKKSCKKSNSIPTPKIEIEIELKTEIENTLSEKPTSCESEFNKKFEEFRKAYTGTKRGFETEFKNFKKHKDWKLVIDLILPATQKEIEHKKKELASAGWTPQQKNLQTWINNRCWEQEHAEIAAVSNQPDKKQSYSDEEIKEIVKKKNPKVHLGYLVEAIRMSNIAFRDDQHKLNTYLSFSERTECQVKS